MRTFEVVSVLKGSVEPGSRIEVFVTVGNSLRGPQGTPITVEFSHPELESGKEYVIFTRAQDPESNPAAWGFWGEPEVAELGASGDLTFLISDGYREELRERGQLQGRGGAGSAFNITLQELQALAR